MRIQAQISQVFDKLLTHSIRRSPRGGQVYLRIEKLIDGQVHGYIKNSATEIETNPLPPLGDQSKSEHEAAAKRQITNAQTLAQVKDLITAHGGKVWVEASPGQGSVFHFTLLPPA